MRPFDFAQFENLCDLRLVLETASVRKLCEPSEQADADLEARASVWLVTKEQRLSDELTVSGCDEDFHRTLVESAGNPEIARVHGDMMERIRIIRRLDFTQTHRIEKTYEEHAQILQRYLIAAPTR